MRAFIVCHMIIFRSLWFLFLFIFIISFLSWMSYIFFPGGGLLKAPANMNYWGLHVPAFLPFLARSITWLGLPSLVHHRKKQDVLHRGLNERLRFVLM